MNDMTIIKKKHQCKKCDYSTSKKDHLDRHFTIHIEERPFTCLFKNCCFKSKTRNGLQLHQKSHENLRNHVCEEPECGMSFNYATRLKDHMLVHQDERPHICIEEGCDAAFKLSGSLLTHIVTHSNERPYVCSEDGCGSSFKRKEALKEHMVVHKDDRPHLCPKDGCGLSFKRTNGLQRHMMTHQEERERTYACTFDGCTLAFYRSDTLNDHMKTHSEKKLKCDHLHCDYETHRNTTLRSHTYYHHTAEGNQKLKLEEARIVQLFTANGINFKEQHMIDFSCLNNNVGSRCFIDFLLQIKDVNGTNGIIFLEVDENQHLHYEQSCETRRMSEVYQSLTLEGNMLPVLFLRYNPNAFKRDNKSVRLAKRDREKVLLETIKNWEFTQGASVYYMYYDIIDKKPVIFNDTSYSEHFKDYFIGCI